MQWQISNGCLVTPDKVIKQASLIIKDNRITKISSKKNANTGHIDVDLDGLLVFPGLINCHDHLLGTYFPRVGDRKPYLNWLMWDNDLKASPCYAERQQVESSNLYTLGGYRHLISGVTSVQDHIPHFVQNMFKKEMPIRVIDKFTLAHSVGSFALPWGEGIEVEHKRAKENNIPFIVHCSEGFDEETLQSVAILESKGALSEHTTLIHGIAFSDSDIQLLAKHKVNVVWCPVSNLYMFDVTAPIKKLIDAKINVVLGTDSPMSGSINIFEELYIAKNYYKETYSEELSSKLIVDMITTRAAKAMYLPQLGLIKEDNLADLLVIDGRSNDPYECLTGMGFANIMLVVIGGRPKYADESFIKLFEMLEIPYQKIKVASSRKIIEGDLLGLLKEVRDAVSFHKEFPFLPIEPW